jgi:hypothetical protein
MREIPQVFISPDPASTQKPKPKYRSRILDLSKAEIESILDDLYQKISSPLFYSKSALRAMKKRRRDLETRLSDIEDSEEYQRYERSLNSNRCQDSDINFVRQSDLSRKGKSELKAKAGGYRIRPGPKREGGSKPSKAFILKRLAS